MFAFILSVSVVSPTFMDQLRAYPLEQLTLFIFAAEV